MLEQFKRYTIDTVLRRGAKDEAAKVAESQRGYNDAKQKAAHKPTPRNPACVCGHTSSRHPALNACTEM